MRSIRSSLNCGRRGVASEQGFTLMELLVTCALSLVVGALALSSVISNKRTLNFDLVRTRVDQNLRSAMDVLQAQLRVGGENLTSFFPAFELVNGSMGMGDTLFVRRNLLDEVLPVCQNIAAGSTTTSVVFGDTAATASACAYSGQAQSYNSWRTYRTSNGNSVRAYIFNTSTKQGEWIQYTGETNTGTRYSIQRSAGAWTYAYPVGSSSVYILEEWKFSLLGDLLSLELDGQPSSVRNIAAGISNFQVTIHQADGTAASTWARTATWSQIASVEVQLSSRESFERRMIERTLSSRFFPRNILSL